MVSWRWVFLINVPLSVIAIGLLLAFVENSRDETAPRRIDFAGLLALAAGALFLTLALGLAARGSEPAPAGRSS